ncbi:hypothetical protein tloyanaT_05830 [Thalassotalea loyana]|uniref:Ice-binding protein C-terminal domain-containing protein n=1 Tax=Thalassotalea loyana TaxID=280483 RepID=A0ABQ6HBP2_9GAMM|nr:PEP-CTERM sorting domain-containing protein [Thalassotalea loyana]GLX84331.1 hypothetical protein tloyanaT_05830 [Thalassotalea loyana]
MKASKLMSIFAAVGFSVSSQAGIINFESNGACYSVSDNQVIPLTQSFTVGETSVRFGFDTDEDGVIDANAVYEQAGNNDQKTGFISKAGKDQAASGYESQLGNFFLRQANAYKPFGVFSILYDSDQPVTGASGEIWDIDGGKNKTEQFLVKAFNHNQLLASILSPIGNNSQLDGKPWAFGFSGLSDITRIDISFVGSKTKGIGLAFDNFSPIQNASALSSVSVPEPASILMLSLGIIGLGLRKLRQPNQAVETVNRDS